MIESIEPNEPKTVKRWTFLTNHALVLLFVARHHRITARELCLELGITERAVRMIIANLEEAGYLQKIREGRTVKYVVNHDMPMRHPTQQDVAIGDFLETLRTSLPSAGKRSRA
ncbi:MAG: winged helix-turn-helix domain-containing protein [Pseudomonadota bacterium]|nr:winged helix-turn-helix domain-containing protein [Patescibacteria group bacterium]